MSDAALAFEGVSHWFGDVRALHDVSLTFRPGSIHAVLGHNGAGKTTLVRSALGLCRPTRGTIRVDGHVRTIATPSDASRLGLGMVHQHFSSIDAMDIGEHLALGARGLCSRRSRNRDATVRLGRAGLDLRPDRKVGTLSVGETQRLEIVRALERARRVLLLDEPTATLSPPEISDLFDQLRTLRDDGLAIVLITHRLAEVRAVADHVTVLRDGAVQCSEPLAGLTDAAIAHALVPDGATPPPPRASRPPGDAVLTLDRLAGDGFGPVDLIVRRGEVIAVAGMAGHGQTPLAETLAGLRRPTSGEWRHVGPRPGFISGDRQRTGLALDLSVAENVLLRRGLRRGGWWSRASVHAQASALLRDFDVRTPSLDQPARALSGGNQQKLVLARELGAGADVLLAEQPTRGLDLEATRTVHHALARARDDGAGVLVWTTDIDEALALGDTLYVATNGRLHRVPRDRDAIARAMIGVGEHTA